ncbi:MAG: tRNA uridine-5-carboxymethylaminomethyl(34) synthesis enzyme MnmG [Candidatus Aminicenantes bacterium]|nr:tRNA uridine-5-carboxymethylaminomethyl(34) synthesis enzyme MnmG [Candidatus Aminicenantes bacterium]
MKIVVIGAGHAGIEAAYAAARMGAEATLLTIHLETLAQMSCNPSIGGIAKGHLVKEIDVLGGVMPRVADATGIHFKVLNRSKGPAVRATRTQNDKIAYRNFMKSFLETVPQLRIFQGIASAIVVANGRVCGVRLAEGETLAADAVIVCSGTFLSGLIHIGSASYPAGRANEPPALLLAEAIAALGFQILRLKTGTPMRLHADSIDWEKFIPQPGDEPPQPFSMFTRGKVKNRILCHLGHTTAAVGAIVRDHLHLSPLYSGKITGIGPRYCPSLEDKIVKFAGKERHHFYLEPEGLRNKEVYVNGLSTSLPIEIQKKVLGAIPGLERAQMMRPAYAIEYDAIQPTQLRASLEARLVENLFFAGQVNGTSGYEEAAAQGLMAGVNAVLKVRGEAPFVLNRDEAYIGVMIDDIVRNGVDEPYRLFTARAEYRLQLREDNVFERLGGHGLRLGLLARAAFDRETRRLERRRRVVSKLARIKGCWNDRSETFFKLLKMPEMTFEKLEELNKKPLLKKKTLTDVSYIEAAVKYEGYVDIQKREVAKMQKMQKTAIPDDLDFALVDGLSIEMKQKLARARPGTLGDAARLPGVTPAALNAVSIHLTLKYKQRS